MTKAAPIRCCEPTWGMSSRSSISSGEGAEHDIVFPELNVHSKHFNASTDASAAVSVPSQDAAPGDGARSGPVARKLAIAPPAANAVSVAMDPTAVPKPLGPRAPQLVRYSIETVELDGKLDHGTTFTYWTFGKKVPGPMLRVKKGDTVELILTNNKSSKAIHSIDLHSVTGGHGGGEHTQVAPGESKTFRFKALNPGL